jgi:hypothetical protein
LADQVLLKIVCLLMRWLFSLAVLVVRSDGEKNAELLVLRHENAVLRRSACRLRACSCCRRVFLAGGRGRPGHARAGVACRACWRGWIVVIS